jgi:hypothetical protein
VFKTVIILEGLQVRYLMFKNRYLCTRHQRDTLRSPNFGSCEYGINGRLAGHGGLDQLESSG